MNPHPCNTISSRIVKFIKNRKIALTKSHKDLLLSGNVWGAGTILKLEGSGVCTSLCVYN